MPLFEFVCTECGSEFEKIVSSHKTKVICKRCRSPKIEKKLSVFAVAGERNDAPVEGFCGTCGSDSPGTCGMN